MMEPLQQALIRVGQGGRAFTRGWALPRLMAVMLAALLLPVGFWPVEAAPAYPALSGRVVDAAGMMDPAIAAQLEQELAAQEGKTSDQLVIATIPSLEGRPVEDYANGLFRAWKLGQEKANNGILLLVAPNDHEVRIEVGYGLEGILTDAVASTIIRNAIIPDFKAGNMSEGTRKGAEAILEVLNLDPEEARARARALEAQQDDMTDEDWIDLIIFVLFIAFCIYVAWRSGGGQGGNGVRRRRSSTLGGVPVSTWDWGRGGGSWGGGGGWSGGGGASGRW